MSDITKIQLIVDKKTMSTQNEKKLNHLFITILTFLSVTSSSIEIEDIFSVKENLDSFEEVQDFMDKMIKKHAISVEVIKFSQEGKSQTLKYDWDGEKWLKTSK